MSKRKWQSLIPVIVIALLLPTNLGATMLPHVSAATTAGPSPRPVINLSGVWVRGSVALGDLNNNGVQDIVVGGTDGKIYAYKGDGTKLWEYNTRNDTGAAGAIEGKPAIGDIDGDGWNEVVVGVSSTFTPLAPGGVWAISHDGKKLWYHLSGDFTGAGGGPNGVPDGVVSSPALADLLGDGKLEIIYGGFDAYIHVLRYNGTVLWEKFVRDTIWSSPAIGDVDRDGRPEIVIGVDSHWEPAFGTQDGGMLHVLHGTNGSELPGFPKQVDEVIYSSPALGDLDGDGWLEIVVGTGYCWPDTLCAVGRPHAVTKALYGWDHLGNPLPGWPISLPDFAWGSPALGDLNGDGKLDIIVNTNDGYIRTFRSNGTPLWSSLVTTPSGPGTVVHFATHASPLLADLNGDGKLEVILPSNWEIVVWSNTGQQLTWTQCCPVPAGQWTLLTEYSLSSTPAIGDVEGDGNLELVVGGARSGGSQGAIYAWDLNARTTASTPWTSFRRDGYNSGRYPMQPSLSGTQAPITLLHDSASSSTSERGSFTISNSGGGVFNWTASAPSGVTLSPAAGTLGSSSQLVIVTVSTAGKARGFNSIGTIVVMGTLNGSPVAGSPLNIPVTLWVGQVKRIFLPFVGRN